MEHHTETYTKTFSIDVERANYHHKCKIRRRKRILIVALIWALILVYIFTPFSKVNLKVTGNVYYTKKELMQMTYMNKNDHWWLFNTKNAKKTLESYTYIDNVSFSKSFFGVKLKINEVYPIAIKDNKYVMSDKQLIEKEEYDLNNKIINLTSFDDINYDLLDVLVNEYRDIKLDVRNHFEKVEIVSSLIGENEYYNYVKLYGNDEKIGSFVIKVDLVYLNTKFNGNKYSKIIEEVSKNNVKYGNDSPALIAYHYLNEEEFHLVGDF